ncbi:hypothetical protein [Flavobacterium sp.]|uniref:hypothetical protein n=1 Tax=Flavobacterium sp. TaxID=239 RepID=UPI0026338CC6|nr:hypothetical protein [Flavobacterium sp.]
MKKIIFLVIISCFTLNSFSQKRVYIDENGNVADEVKFLKRWRDTDNELSRWDYIKKDSGRVQKLSKNLHNLYKVDYDTILENLNKLLVTKIPKNKTLIIEFIYLYDLCNDDKINFWSKSKLKFWNSFSYPTKKRIEKENSDIIYITLFDKDIVIDPYISTIENFKIDKNNFFKANFFKKPTLCGSYLVIKPDGYALVRNGEYTADRMLQYLEPQVWNQTFPNH